MLVLFELFLVLFELFRPCLLVNCYKKKEQENKTKVSVDKVIWKILKIIKSNSKLRHVLFFLWATL